MKFFFLEKKKNKCAIYFGFGLKLDGLISIIFFIFNFQLANIDNLP